MRAYLLTARIIIGLATMVTVALAGGCDQANRRVAPDQPPVSEKRAVPPQQVDLACSGTVRTEDGEQRHSESPWEDHISIDLAAMRFTDNDRTTPISIKNVDPYHIVLMEPPVGQFGPQLEIDRTTGKLDYSMFADGKMYFLARAICKADPFTPFPRPKF
jgi:hypothetical protein